jgi:hypothetical protein
VPPVTESIAAYIGGFVAAEGCFTGTTVRFTFSVGLGASDERSCWFRWDYFGCGHVYRSPRRQAHYDDEITFAILGTRDHLAVTLPFMDEHLPPSYKRQQYTAWRRALLAHCQRGAGR